MTLRYWHSYILIHMYTLDILLVFLKNTVSEAFLFRSHSLSICSNMFPYTWPLGYHCWKYCMIKMNLFCYHILCHGCRCLTNHNSHKITLKLNKHTTMYFYKMPLLRSYKVSVLYLPYPISEVLFVFHQ